MVAVEPIRDYTKIIEIKRRLSKGKPVLYLLFTMGLNTALRIGDLLAVKEREVLEPDGTVRDYLELREAKTGKQKRVRLNGEVRDALERYTNGRKPRDTFLFLNPVSKKAYSRVQVWRWLNQWCREVGIKDHIGAHTLRKTWGYMARTQKSVPIELIQAKLGHASPSVTRRYIGITGDEINTVEEAVEL